MGLIWMLLRSSTKIFATFVVLIFLTFVMILFMPDMYVWLQNLAEGIDDYVRNPPMESQNIAIYRFFVNGATILSVIMTLIARAIVEGVAAAGGGIWKGMKVEEKKDAEVAKAKDGYYEA